jgi:hypothetical protein
MSQNSNGGNSNGGNSNGQERMLLVNILQNMYDDNIRQINGMNNSIHHLRNANTQIRNLLVELLNRSSSANPPRSNTFRNNRVHHNRVMLNNVPYVMDHVEQYTIPLTSQTMDPSRNEERNNAFMESFLTPVQVYPSPIQIEHATRVVRYSDIVNPVHRTCPISLEPFLDTDRVSVIRYCGHIFKQEHLVTWFRTNCKCPVCRYDIRNYPVSNESMMVFTDVSNNTIERGRSPVVEPIPPVEQVRPVEPIRPVEQVLSIEQTIEELLINEFANIVDTGTSSTILSFLQNSLQRRG